MYYANKMWKDPIPQYPQPLTVLQTQPLQVTHSMYNQFSTIHPLHLLHKKERSSFLPTTFSFMYMLIFRLLSSKINHQSIRIIKEIDS